MTGQQRGEARARVAALLLARRPPGAARAAAADLIPWLGDLHGQPADRKRADKFLLFGLLNWRMTAPQASANVVRLAEQELKDPPYLWHAIISIPRHIWQAKHKQGTSLHWLAAAHDQVWVLAGRVVRDYGGDARTLWADQPPAEVVRRLHQLGVAEQVARTIVAELIAAGQIAGRGDIRADLPSRRVLGRVLRGAGPLSEAEAAAEARALSPSNPWLVDLPLWEAGKRHCVARQPRCGACYLQPACAFWARARGGPAA